MSREKGSRLLRELRDAMQQESLKAYIIPSSDAHNSEYVAPQFQSRAYISNFKGSAGTCLVTETEALLWTDGRYWLEAENTMYPDWKLMRSGALKVPTMEEWIVDHLGLNSPVGMNSKLSTCAAWEKMSKDFYLVSSRDLVQAMMEDDPDCVAPEAVQIYVHEDEFAGSTCREKVAAVVEGVVAKKADLVVLSALDEIAWVSNLRGGDVPYNPVFYAYGVVLRDEVASKVGGANLHLFVDEAKVSAGVREARRDVIEFHPYDDLGDFLEVVASGAVAVVDENQNSQALLEMLTDHKAQIRRVKCGVAQSLKAKKSAREIDGFRACHIRDGVALTRYLAWLHDQITRRGAVIDEYEGSEKLLEFRQQEKYFVQPSFPTISSSGPNGAIIHYRPEKETAAVIDRAALYLVDSGAQYLDGTTDVTRTITFGAPTDEECVAYTLVLKGHIAINQSVWPSGTAGYRIDAFSRAALWKSGLNFSHGTGHGVGYFLNVHEGPQGIGIRPTAADANMEEGMVLSNEPGYYKDGHYGIRIENLEYIVPAPTAFSKTGYFTFRQLTMAPLCRRLIKVELLTDDEVAWVNRYHAKVNEHLLPPLEAYGDRIALAYLAEQTKPLARHPAWSLRTWRSQPLAVRLTTALLVVQLCSAFLYVSAM